MTSEQSLVAGVVLAAGESSRFGRENKLLLDLGVNRVIYHSLRAILESGANPIYLITGHQSELLVEAIEELRDDPKLQIVNNWFWATGRASSLSLALENLPDGARGALIHLGDMPLVTTALINRLISCFLESDQLTFPIIDGRKGNPIIWPRRYWSQLMKFQKDNTAFELVKDLWDQAKKLELKPKEHPTQWDLDTRQNYERMIQHWSERS